MPDTSMNIEVEMIKNTIVGTSVRKVGTIIKVDRAMAKKLEKNGQGRVKGVIKDEFELDIVDAVIDTKLETETEIEPEVKVKVEPEVETEIELDPEAEKETKPKKAKRRR